MSPSTGSVDQSTPFPESDSTRLPLKERVMELSQLPGLAGIARHTGSRDGRWMTAMSSWLEPTLRKPREKTPLGSFRMGWNGDWLGLALKPLLINWSCEEDEVAVHEVVCIM